MVFCNPTNSPDLFTKYLPSMAKDFIYQYKTNQHQSYKPSDPIILAHVATDITKDLEQHSKEWSDFELLDIDLSIIGTTMTNSAIREEISYTHKRLESDTSNVSNMNND